MVELASDVFVCIVDESKLVDGLGGSKGRGFNHLIISECTLTERLACNWLTQTRNIERIPGGVVQTLYTNYN